MNETRLIAVDWGTSSLRGARLDAEGRALEERGFDRGILGVVPGTFPAVFAECFGDWLTVPPGPGSAQPAPQGEQGNLGRPGVSLASPETPCLISGMAGSRQGWVEAPYCPCPAGFGEVAQALSWIEPGRIAIVPGLSTDAGTGTDAVPDVMRGEEVQVFGAMQLGSLRDGLFILPGTHSKWVRVQGGSVTGFRTFMTGEFYALLSKHSLLARSLAADAPFDASAFLDGIARARGGAGLLHTAFGTRTLDLFGRRDGAALASYLSGLVIGEELRSGAAEPGEPVVLIGSPALTARYAQAFGAQGHAATAFGAEATWAGLHALAGALR